MDESQFKLYREFVTNMFIAEHQELHFLTRCTSEGVLDTTMSYELCELLRELTDNNARWKETCVSIYNTCEMILEQVRLSGRMYPMEKHRQAVQLLAGLRRIFSMMDRLFVVHTRQFQPGTSLYQWQYHPDEHPEQNAEAELEEVMKLLGQNASVPAIQVIFGHCLEERDLMALNNALSFDPSSGHGRRINTIFWNMVWLSHHQDESLLLEVIAEMCRFYDEYLELASKFPYGQNTVLVRQVSAGLKRIKDVWAHMTPSLQMAWAMGSHGRLNQQSPFRHLPKEVFPLVAEGLLHYGY